MRKKIAYIFIWLSATLLLLHTFTPHHHVEVLSGRALVKIDHKCPNSVLVDIFKFDPGSHHLEEFRLSRHDVDFAPMHVEFAGIFAFTVLEKDRSADYKIFPIPHNQRLISLFLRRSHSLRAPPVLMS